ncbi:MAG: hypothetical protein ABIH11_02335 [Candidatus Altiarchaeota archaeon]
MKNSLLISLITLLVILPSVSGQNDSNTTHEVTAYVFWAYGCPHCAAEKPFMEALDNEYPWLTVKYYEISSDYKNAELYSNMVKACGQNPLGVPATVIDDEVFFGYDDNIRMGARIHDRLLKCHQEGCIDAILLVNGSDACVDGTQNDTSVDIPLIGKVDATQMSLPLFTIVIGGLDGFNPCAFFVLFFLLSLLIHARSRIRMFMIGGIFVFFSGFIYFLFMAAWLNFFLFIGQIKAITLIAGIIALIVALLNIKDFFWFKKGVSLSIPESAKPKLFSRMRDLVKASELPSMVLGTAILAIAANTYELLCTAGFPMVYTRVLTLNNLSTTGYYTYLALYNIVYVMPLFTIVMMFTITLGSRKLKEEEGRILKLLSGFMMLSLGVILVVKPGLLNNVVVAVGVLAFSVCATAVVKSLMLSRGKDETADGNQW